MHTVARWTLSGTLSLAVLVGFGGPTAALADDAPAFNPDAVAQSDGAACLGQLVAFAVRPHPGYEGQGLAGDAPGHGFDSVSGLMNGLLRPLCAGMTDTPTDQGVHTSSLGAD
jgi:hypothetical protein